MTFAPAQSVDFKEKIPEDFEEFVDAGRSHGCKYILMRILRAKKIRDAQSGDRHVTLEEIILDTNGVPLSMQTSGKSTEELTIFEAALATQDNLMDGLKNFFK